MRPPITICTVVALPLLTLAAGCAPKLLHDVEVASADGSVRVHAPAGPGWTCRPNDEVKETFRHAGVKCVLDRGLVLTAKLYEVSTADARTAEVFCIQDWKQTYGSFFATLVSSTAKVTQLRGTPACEVALEGTTTKGPWRIWELHAPNGKKLLQVNVSGALGVAKQEQRLVDAWLADLRYDLSVPGQR